MKLNINDVIDFESINEISVDDLIYAIDKSNDFSIYEINENEISDEKNILIRIYK